MLGKYNIIQSRMPFKFTVNHDHSLLVEDPDTSEFFLIDPPNIDNVNLLISALQEYKKYLIEEVGL